MRFFQLGSRQWQESMYLWSYSVSLLCTSWVCLCCHPSSELFPSQSSSVFWIQFSSWLHFSIQLSTHSKSFSGCCWQHKSSSSPPHMEKHDYLFRTFFHQEHILLENILSSDRFFLCSSLNHGDTLRFFLYGSLLHELLLVVVTHFYSVSESRHKPQQLFFPSLPLFSLMTWIVHTIHVGLINSIFHRHHRLNSPRLCSHWDGGKSLVWKSV